MNRSGAESGWREWCDDIIEKAAKKSVYFNIINSEDKLRLKIFCIAGLATEIVTF